MTTAFRPYSGNRFSGRLRSDRTPFRICTDSEAEEGLSAVSYDRVSDEKTLTNLSYHDKRYM